MPGGIVRRRVVRFVMVAVVALGCATATHAQEVSLGGGAKMKIGGRFHMQYNTTSVDSSDGDPIPETEFLLRRARLTFDVTFNDLISARIEPDYSSIGGVGLFSLRDAYMRLTFGSGLRATAGQFKRPFDVFELTSSTQILVAERGGQVRGVTACGRIATVCSYSNLSAGLLYSDRDLGLMLDGALVPGRLQYAIAATNGQTLRQRESNSGKQLTGRLSVIPLKDLVVSGNVSWKDYTNVATASAERAVAWGTDVEFGTFTRGLHIQAGLLGGDNWRQPTADSTGIESFVTSQVIATWRVPVRHRWIDGLEPTLRASWADPNLSADDDDGWLITPGAMLHLGSRNRLYVNVDIWMPQVGDTEYALLTQLNFYF
jgi:hypothetical protein